MSPNSSASKSATRPQFPMVDIDLDSTGLRSAGSVDIRKYPDGAFGKYEGTKTIKCVGLTKSPKDTAKIRIGGQRSTLRSWSL